MQEPGRRPRCPWHGWCTHGGQTHDCRRTGIKQDSGGSRRWSAPRLSAAMNRDGALREALQRGAVLGSVVLLHALMLLFVLHSTGYRRGGKGEPGHGSQPLRLRLFQRPPPTRALSAKPLSQAPRMTVHKPSILAGARRITYPPQAPPPALVAPRVAALPQATASHGQSGRRPVTTPPARNDGGFQARLEQAQQANAVHGVPGASTPYVPGLHLIDPATRGLGAVARRAQQLFGIANHHCIDVDVWRHLTPRELSDRHISPGEVARVEAQNHCNDPPGLHF